MKIYHNNKRVRDWRGRYAKQGNKNKIIKIAVVLALIVLAFHYGGGYEAVSKYVEAEPIVIENKIDTAKPKIESMKWGIVDELADCESGGIPEGRRNAQVTMDTNGYYSRGKWQFQLPTVQHYMHKLHGVDISLDEATLIAHDEKRARKLAYDIIWEEVGGIWNWENCARKLGLAPKIEVIRALDSE